MWHVSCNISEEHKFLHYLRVLRLSGLGKKEYPGLVYTKPSAYTVIEKQFFKKIIKLTPLGEYYCDYIWTYTGELEKLKSKMLHGDENRNRAEARFQEAVPVLLQRYGFKSRADYLVKWSIFRGALGDKDSPLIYNYLNIFDQLSDGIKNREDCLKSLEEEIELFS